MPCNPIKTKNDRYLYRRISPVAFLSEKVTGPRKNDTNSYYDMDYSQVLDYLYHRLPMFQQIGSTAYKEGLDTTIALDNYLGNPHTRFRSIHIGGTNGKGSCSHTLAAILQEAGYKTGLYTSPHLIDFRERIRVNGQPVSESFVVEFVNRYRPFFETYSPSFFELTTVMAFQYFAEQEVDIAVIEVGLGGRLDCTNIITPTLSIITNISLDHTRILGDTPAKIAKEKAGIIKPGVPVVIGESSDDIRPVFVEQAKKIGAPVFFAEEEPALLDAVPDPNGGWIYRTDGIPDLHGELGGLCQLNNTNTILSAIRLLIRQGYQLFEPDIRVGFAQVCERTGLKGRWQKVGTNPTVICDTGHNVGGIAYIVEQLKRQKYAALRIVIGMVNDKDIDGVLKLLPREAIYYFTRATVERALPPQELAQKAARHRLIGNRYNSVAEAYTAACDESAPDDLIFVGGSTFIVADLLTLLGK